MKPDLPELSVDDLYILLGRYLDTIPKEGEPNCVRVKIVDWPANVAADQINEFLAWVERQ